jgi:ABC-2 type transport system ATP-binding protein
MDELGLKVVGLKKTYPKTLRQPAVDAVKGFDLDVRDGEVVGLLGPNGAGKTTAIKAICGLLKPTAGEIFIGPYSLARDHRRALARMAVVLEGDRNLRFRLTVRENVTFFTSLAGCDPRRVREETPATLERFDLAGKAKEQVRNLSKGQKQKLSVAIAYLTRAELVLLDEPTLGLDVQAGLELQNIIREMAREGRAVLLTTHEMAVAQKVADRIAIVNEGRLVTFRPMEELLELFRYHQYTIRLRWPETAPASIGLDAADVELVTTDDHERDMTLHLHTDRKDRLYEILTWLRSEECEILEIARHQPDLERVFLSIVENDGRRPQ